MNAVWPTGIPTWTWRPSGRRHSIEALVVCGDAEGLDRDVGAAAGEVADRARRVAGAGIDRGVGAEGEGVVELFLDDVDDDDAGADRPGDEQRREADAAGAVDGEPFAGVEVGAAGEGVPCGGGAAAEGGGGGRRHALGQAGEVVGEGDGDELGEGAGLDEAGKALVGAGVLVAGLAGRALAAGEDEGGDEAVADLPRREGTGLDDLAAVLVAGDLAGLHPRVLAGPAVPVGAADAAGEDLEDDAVGLADGRGDVLEREVGVVLSQDRGAHGSPSPSPSSGKLDDLVVLDHGVGEELLAHLGEAGAGGAFVGLGEVELDDLAHADALDAAEAEAAERVADGLALRVEDAALQGDVDARLHAGAFIS